MSTREQQLSGKVAIVTGAGRMQWQEQIDSIYLAYYTPVSCTDSGTHFDSVITCHSFKIQMKMGL